MGNKLRIAIYMRLSKADKPEKKKEDFDKESNSIQMQRAMLQSYVQKNFLEYELLQFCDDGYSGTNFNRPGVMELLELVKESAVDCIVVKDFSRFSRDYIELGFYLDQIFPFMGVRFISINDGYDSKECCGGVGELDVSFKHLLYDLYSKDLSMKVKSSLAVRKDRGQYVSANCPFGYKKASNDRHMLVIEEDEAEVVRRIFSLALVGYTSIDIAKQLGRDGIKTPAEFKIAKGKTKRMPKGDVFTWNLSTINTILRNDVYAGDMVYGKTERKEVGGKNSLKPREEWKIYSDHHEPIIDRKTFKAVQESRRNVSGKGKGKRKRHPLIGILVCSCCGKNLCYRSGLNPYFHCSGLYVYPKENSVKKANAMFLEQYVLYEIQQKVQELADMEKLRVAKIEALEQSHEVQVKGLLSLKKQKKKLEGEKRKIYEWYRENAGTDGSKLTAMEYQEKTDEITDRMQELDILIQEQEQRVAQIEEQIPKKSGVSGSLDFHGAMELTDDVVQRFIEKIVVSDEEHMEIFWKDFKTNI